MESLAKKVIGKLVGRRVTEMHEFPASSARVHGDPDALTTVMGDSASELLLGTEKEGKIVSSQWVDDRTRTFLKGKLTDEHIFRLGDGSFYLPTVSEVRAILSASQLDRRTYMAERFDCDDYSYVLKGEMSVHAYEVATVKFGLCVGIIWGNFTWVQGFHAVNWFIDSDEQLKFIEPQTDEIFESTETEGDVNLLVV